MTDPTPCLFITRNAAAAFCPAAVAGLTAGRGRAVVAGPVRQAGDQGFQVKVYGPDIPASGRAVTNGDVARLGFH